MMRGLKWQQASAGLFDVFVFIALDHVYMFMNIWFYVLMVFSFGGTLQLAMII